MNEKTRSDFGSHGGSQRIKKWYFSLSEASIDRRDHGWRSLTRVAVGSALRNTSLRPYLLYDGHESDFTAELQAMGVTIIHHRVSFYNQLVEIASTRTADYLGIALGVFLRVEIPWIETDDDFVLFTDCDVMFLSNPRLETTPGYFAAAPQTSKTDYDTDMNAGVMVMNIPALRNDLPQFINFITENLDKGWPGCDQENYRRFYAGKWDRLDLSFNWKPYWGYNPKAHIVHWHGPKPQMVRRLLLDPAVKTNPGWLALFERDVASYGAYLQDWDALATGSRRDIVGFLDQVSESGGGGWAICPDDLSRPVKLTVIVDDTPIRTLVCDQPRRDIKAAYGTEAAGFTFAIPGYYRDGKRHKLEFRDEKGLPVSLKRGDSIFRHYCFSQPTDLVTRNSISVSKHYTSANYLYYRSRLLPYVNLTSGKGLEIGAFDRPFFTPDEADVSFADYRSTEEAVAYAKIATGHYPETVVKIDYTIRSFWRLGFGSELSLRLGLYEPSFGACAQPSEVSFRNGFKAETRRARLIDYTGQAVHI